MVAADDVERVGFALRHLYVYPRLRLAYTYIPKNACTLLKRTFGEAQGWLTSASHSAHEMRRGRWLRGLASAARAEERIVVVRDPFDRVLSAYLSKFVLARDDVADQAIGGGLAALLPDGATRVDVTFADFVTYLSRTDGRYLDEHWRPQHEFLIGRYTRVVRFDDLAAGTAFLAGRGLTIDVQANRGTSGLMTHIGPGWGDKPAGRLRVLRRRRGLLPGRDDMYDDRLRQLVATRFADDVDLADRARRR